MGSFEARANNEVADRSKVKEKINPSVIDSSEIDAQIDRVEETDQEKALILDTDGKKEVRADRRGCYELSGRVEDFSFNAGDSLVCERVDEEEWSETFTLGEEGDFYFELPPGEYEFYLDRGGQAESIGDTFTVKTHRPPKGPWLKANVETDSEAPTVTSELGYSTITEGLTLYEGNYYIDVGADLAINFNVENVTEVNVVVKQNGMVITEDHLGNPILLGASVQDETVTVNVHAPYGVNTNLEIIIILEGPDGQLELSTGTQLGNVWDGVWVLI